MFFQSTGQMGSSFGGYIPPPPPLNPGQTGRGQANNNTFATYPTIPTIIPNISSPNTNIVAYPGASGNNIFQTISALISQGVSAFGRNPSIQIGTSPTVQTPLSTTLQAGAGLTAALNPPQNLQYPPGYTNTPGGAAQSGIDGILAWVTANPLIVLLGVGGFYLLMREPPRSRR